MKSIHHIQSNEREMKMKKITRKIQIQEIQTITLPIERRKEVESELKKQGFQIESISIKGDGLILEAIKKDQAEISDIWDLKKQDDDLLPQIKFNQHNIRNIITGEKARVNYSVDPDIKTGEARVIIYGKDILEDLGKIFPPELVQNNTDTMTDYFEKDRVILFPSSPYFKDADRAARKRLSSNQKRYERQAEKLGTRMCRK
jgi:hypothetical protein